VKPQTRIGRASTDKLLENFGRNGSRHNDGHNTHLALMLLMFLRQNIPCAVVLRLIRALLGEPSDVTVAGRDASASLACLTLARVRQDHTISPYASAPLVERHLSVHRIPARVRDDRDTPLDSGLEQNGNIREDLKRVKGARTRRRQIFEAASRWL